MGPKNGVVVTPLKVAEPPLQSGRMTKSRKIYQTQVLRWEVNRAWEDDAYTWYIITSKFGVFEFWLTIELVESPLKVVKSPLEVSGWLQEAVWSPLEVFGLPAKSSGISDTAKNWKAWNDDKEGSDKWGHVVDMLYIDDNIISNHQFILWRCLDGVMRLKYGISSLVRFRKMVIFCRDTC